MLRTVIAFGAAMGVAQVAYAQATAGDQGAPGTSTNQNPSGTAGRGSGTQGTATNNQSGQSGAARVGQAGREDSAGSRPGRPGQVEGATGIGGTANQGGGAGQMAGAARNIEGHAADCLILKNEEEIEILQSSMSKIQNSDLKQAAQKMVKDHQQAISKLQRFAMHRSAGAAGENGQSGARSTGQGAAAAGTQAGAGTTGGATTRDPSTNTTGASGTATTASGAKAQESLRIGTDNQGTARDAAAGRNSSTAGVRTPGGSPLANALFQVAQREKEECLKLTQADLAKHEGVKFDKALTGQQAVMHAGMLAKLRALQGQASSEFSQVLQELEQTTEEHKQHLDQLMEALAKDTGAGQTRR